MNLVFYISEHCLDIGSLIRFSLSRIYFGFFRFISYFSMAEIYGLKFNIIVCLEKCYFRRDFVKNSKFAQSISNFDFIFELKHMQRSILRNFQVSQVLSFIFIISRIGNHQVLLLLRFHAKVLFFMANFFWLHILLFINFKILAASGIK